MDDLQKDILHVWELRLKLEKTKKKLRRIEEIMKTEEFSQKFSYAEQAQIRTEMTLLKKDVEELEEKQTKIEETIDLPNPYLNAPD